MARGIRDEIAPGEIKRIQRREFLRRESRERRERSRRLEVFLSSAASLREVKARKTPSASSDVGGVFRYGADSLWPARDLKPCDRAGLTVELCRNQHDPCVIYLQGKVCRVMPAWMEI